MTNHARNSPHRLRTSLNVSSECSRDWSRTDELESGREGQIDRPSGQPHRRRERRRRTGGQSTRRDPPWKARRESSGSGGSPTTWVFNPELLNFAIFVIRIVFRDSNLAIFIYFGKVIAVLEMLYFPFKSQISESLNNEGSINPLIICSSLLQGCHRKAKAGR